MDFVATYWWVWLITAILSAGYALWFQLRRAKLLARSTLNTVTTFVTDADINPHKAIKSVGEVVHHVDKFLGGMEKLVAAVVIASLFGIIFIVSIIVNIAKMFTG